MLKNLNFWNKLGPELGQLCLKVTQYGHNKSIQEVRSERSVPTEGALKGPLALSAIPLTCLLLVTSLPSYDVLTPLSHGPSAGRLLMQLWLETRIGGGGGSGASRLSFAGCAKQGFYSPSASSAVMGPGHDEYITARGKPEGGAEEEEGQ